MIQEAEVQARQEIKSRVWLKPAVRGKFLTTGPNSLWVKGVTYGTFRPSDKGEYNRHTVESDFALMRQNHINAVRIYTMPPEWMLDFALEHGIHVFAGFPWEEHVTFLDQSSLSRSIRNRLKTSLKEIANHPALLCCAIGNEIPSTIVRWYGARKIQNYLRTLYETAKECDPDLLVTYVNYPSTEYLHLPFLDFHSFNVFLESKISFQKYLSRLHNLAGEKPLVLTEIGLDSQRNGLERQARLLRSQIWSSLRSGCAGVFVYSWTDEWFRGGAEIDDWDFGLTTRDRHPKPSLDAVRKQFAKVPFRRKSPAPKISVIICSYNGAKTIEQCLKACMQLQYSDYEVIVIDDGSTDSTAEITARYPVRLIRTPNQGLSAARNLGMKEAQGEILAYIDDDAYPDRNWLHYLAIGFEETEYACIGGPNLAPPEDGWIAQSIAHSPGGPVHVLLTDEEAEHVPGCNMAFRKEALERIGGFDPQFRVAGDDVDVCWRLQETSQKIGFQPAAMVWHHRRKSAAAYVRQQHGYGKAEVMLARKWPEKYNGVGHVSWAGRIYRNVGLFGGRIYSGIWGTAPFQSLYERSYGLLSSLGHLPEWTLLMAFLLLLTSFGLLWPPFLLAGYLLLGAVLVPVIDAFRWASRILGGFDGSKSERLKIFFTCAFFHAVQPVARFIGRWPLWQPAYTGFVLPWKQTLLLWSENWVEPSTRLTSLLTIYKEMGAIVSHADSFSRWDLEAIGGAFGRARLLMVTEEHGQGKQLIRFSVRAYSHWLWPGFTATTFFVAAATALSSLWIPSLVLFAFAILLCVRIVLECGRAMSAMINGIRILNMQSIADSSFTLDSETPSETSAAV